MSRSLELPVRYYRAVPIDNPGYEDEILSLDVNTTAIVAIHCWNIGCPDGPEIDLDYCVGAGWPQSMAEAARIMEEVMLPAMNEARRVGLRVCHVESDQMYRSYPQVESRRTQPPRRGTGLAADMGDRAHGAGYIDQSPLVRMKRARIMEPVGDEHMVFYTDQLDDHLREHGIDTLIYMGFMADMCLLNADGGAFPMLGKGYRCLLMRDATVGVESPHTYDERLATRYATHIFEWKIGYGTTLADYLEATKGL
jgi:nicotinamidase-related amidase